MSIRLNSGPLGKHTGDVGNRTSIRMSYPEGTPLHWADTDSHSVFVAVIYKGVDLSWMSAMIRKLGVVSGWSVGFTVVVISFSVVSQQDKICILFSC